MDQMDLELVAQKLLQEFRVAQAKHGNFGCVCQGCKSDMGEAIKVLIQQQWLRIKGPHNAKHAK